MMMLIVLLGCVSDQEPKVTPEQPLEVISEPKRNRPPHRPLNPPQKGGHGPHSPQGMKATVTFDWVGEPSETPKSIILISLDTVQASRMEVYGGRALTPNLMGLVKDSVVFEQAISHFPETALSHWSMMTSVLPEVHGNVPANGGSVYTGPTLAEIAKHPDSAPAAFIGGVTMTDQTSGFARGFDVYDDQFSFKPEDMARDGFQVTAKAKKWIKQQQGPYFAFLHYFDAHFPYTPKAPWNTKYDPDYAGTIDGSDAVLRPYREGEKTPSQRDIEHILSLYDGEISELDEKIKGILSMADPETIVIVTSDHGESFSHGYYFNHRGGLWDEITHVPLIIRSPGFKSGSRVSEQVGLIDLLPTILELAGLPLDSRMQGKSLLPLVNQKDGGREQVYSITDPWMPNPQFAVRTNQWKWISQQQQELVYNLQQDSTEEKNLSTIPIALRDSKEEYRKMMEKMIIHQVEVTAPRKISNEECQRLKSLGYTTCE
jgi:arylsulfatase A-like enzyme